MRSTCKGGSGSAGGDGVTYACRAGLRGRVARVSALQTEERSLQAGLETALAAEPPRKSEGLFAAPLTAEPVRAGVPLARRVQRRGATQSQRQAGFPRPACPAKPPASAPSSEPPSATRCPRRVARFFSGRPLRAMRSEAEVRAVVGGQADLLHPSPGEGRTNRPSSAGRSRVGAAPCAKSYALLAWFRPADR